MKTRRTGRQIWRAWGADVLGLGAGYSQSPRVVACHGALSRPRSGAINKPNAASTHKQTTPKSKTKQGQCGQLLETGIKVKLSPPKDDNCIVKYELYYIGSGFKWYLL